MTRQSEMDTARAWVEIDLGALYRNGAALAAHAKRPLLPMVKADAYGVGAMNAVRALAPLAPWGWGVATAAEGCELRDREVTEPILVFTPLLGTDLRVARDARLTPVLGAADAISEWRDAGGGAWHLGIDTGMSRSGVRWDRVGELRDLLAAFPPEGACTHFHSAERNDGTVALQERRFDDAIAALPSRPRVLHAENSAAIARRSPSPWDFVRPGVFLYGVGSGPGAEIQPEPVVHLRARIAELRDVRAGETVSYTGAYRAVGDRRIATLGIGYADGYVRALSNRGIGLLRGQRVPVAGVVTMDMTMVDVTDAEARDAACCAGDVVTLIGRDGGELLDLETVARTADMSPYELLTGLRGRLSHVCVGEDALPRPAERAEAAA